jgi:anthranilate phosphoribosyltransferase
MKGIINDLINKKQRLHKSIAKQLIFDVTKTDFNPNQLSAILSVFEYRGVSVDEVLGFREGLLELAVDVDLGDDKRIDIVGTGGDGKNTFNISTLSCFVVAAAGFKVSKHGNYASTSISGSSNVLEKLGYSFKSNPEHLREEIEMHNLTFLHAPLFHPALKNVAAVRKQLGFRTFFNIMGPLINPSRPSNQLLGVYSKEVGNLYSDVLQKTEVDYSIVHSADGYDEVSLTDNVNFFSKQGYKLIDVEELKLGKNNAEDLFGGNSIDEAAKIFTDVLQNKADEHKINAVQANSALAIANISGFDYDHSLELAKEAIESQKAYNLLKSIVK